MLLETDIVLRLVLAAILGGVVGYERELRHKPAGLRTHALVCMGSALFTLLTFSFTGPAVDSSRIAAGIVMGIGFLGAGTIFKADDKIHGLTTAAEMWVLAAVGIAVGTGLQLVAIAATLVTLFILEAGIGVESSILRSKRRR